MHKTWRRKTEASISSDDDISENEISDDESLQESSYIQFSNIGSSEHKNSLNHFTWKSSKPSVQNRGQENLNLMQLTSKDVGEDSEKIEKIQKSLNEKPATNGDLSDNSNLEKPSTSKKKSEERHYLKNSVSCTKHETILSGNDQSTSSEHTLFSKGVNNASTPEKQKDLQKGKKFYELELLKEKARLESLKSTAKNVKLDMLPDKGAKLRSSIETQMIKVNELNEQLSLLSLNTSSEASQTVFDSKEITETLTNNSVNLKKDHLNMSEMGKSILDSHQPQHSQTVEALKRFHKFLQTSDKGLEISDPVSIKVPLLPHQKTGLCWLLRRESDIPCGGILADDMGLGKTLTIISLILKDMQNQLKSDTNNFSEDENDEVFSGRKKLPKGKTLIVCPSSVIGQWASEVTSKVEEGTLSVSIHHGNKRETVPRRLADYDMVITTYTILQYENKGDTGPLLNLYWRRVVLDEAHIIRNYNSKTAQAVFALRAGRRWALTGTPIHNKLEDYFSLLKFLKCKPFDDLSIWKIMLDNKTQQGTQRINLITKALLLRRTKEEIQKAGGLKDLKPKKFSNIEIKLDPEEFEIYKKLSQLSSAIIAQYIREKAEKDNALEKKINIREQKNPFADHSECSRLYNQMIKLRGGVKTHHILVLLLRLRQMCCHPSLVTSFVDDEELRINGIEDSEGNDLGLLDQMMNLSLSSKESVKESKQIITSDDPVFSQDRCSSKIREVLNYVNRILEKGNDKIIIVSQWTSVLDIIKSFLSKRSIKSVSLNGSIPVKLRIGIIDDFNKNQYGPKVMLLSLTAGGTGLNLVGANHLLMVDNHWNPQLEAQACDRIYRVGQTKTVHIYKFVCSNTIEERIVKLQKQKLEIAKGIFSGSSKIHPAKLSLHDLQILFNT